ncbi:MAG: hypothetical protein AAF433_03860 [Bacteroidota bacterium]
MHLRNLLWVSSLLFLLTCGKEPDSTPGSPASTSLSEKESISDPPVLTDEFRFTFLEEFKGLSPTSNLTEIRSIFGAENVREGMIYLVDGIEMPGYIVHEGEPEELHIFVPDISEDLQEINILIRQAASPWVSEEGIQIGTSLAELVTINGAPISFAGFSWDYGGFISDWHGGSLHGSAIRLDIGPNGTGDYPLEIMGDVRLRSDNPLLEKVPIIVGEIEVSLTNDPVKIGTYAPGKYFDRIRAGMTRADLIDLYGIEQLRDSQIHIGEGEFVEGAFLFPATPAEVQILYQEEAPHAVASIRISHRETPYYLQDVYQLAPGLDLPGLIALNDGHLEFAGFGWDYAGTVLDWQGGELEGLGVVLSPLNYEEVPPALIGDIPLQSKDLDIEGRLLFEVVEITVPLAD